MGFEFICEKVEGGISGFKISASKRDAIIEIKAMAERHEFDVLGIYMSDRLGRIAEETPLIVSFLNARGIKVISYTEGEIMAHTHTDKLLTYIRYWQAEGESLKTSMRVADAGETNVRQGKWRGGCPPFGYRSVSRGTLNYKGKPIFDVEIHPEQAEVVKTVFRLYTEEHYGGCGIAKHLNDRNITTKEGEMWTKSYVHLVLKNRLYTGVYVLHGRKKTDKPIVESPLMPHMVIIDQATFDKARAICKENDTRPDGHQRKTVHGKQLLTGMLYCGECGKKFTSLFKSYTRTRKSGKVWNWETNSYRCTSYYAPFERKDGGCHQNTYRAEQINELVIADAKAFVKQSDREKLLKASESSTGEQLKLATEKAAKLSRELARIEKEHAKLEEAVVKSLMGDGEYSPALLNKLIADKAKELAVLSAERETADAEKRELQSRFDSQKEFAENLDTWETRFDQADDVAKKAMLLNIIDRIVINPTSFIVTYKLETRRTGKLQPIESPDWLTLPTIDGTPHNPPSKSPDGGGNNDNEPNTALSHAISGVKGSNSAIAEICLPIAP
jgi:DNA invertase Pin-like site-specific DNA recombinase